MKAAQDPSPLPKKVERNVTESSSENSDVCMQELVSPFRQMKLGRD